MIAASLDEIRAAHQQLLVAHGELLREFRAGSDLFRSVDPPAAARHVEEAFVRFVDATESFWLLTARSTLLIRGKPKVERKTIDATFAALSRSVEVLRRNGLSEGARGDLASRLARALARLSLR